MNYAVKSSFLLSFLEAVPEVAAKLKDANTKERKFEDVVKSAEQAAGLVLGRYPELCVWVGFMFYRGSVAQGGEINRSPYFNAS